jgi:uncharacterized membrane protein
MQEPRRGWTDTQVDQRIGNLLRSGVILAATVVLIGAVLLLARGGFGEAPDKRFFTGEPAQFRSFTGIFLDALRLDAKGVIQFGLVLLIITPVARVAFSTFAFALQRDWIYVAITLLVLAVLCFSLAGGRL